MDPMVTSNTTGNSDATIEASIPKEGDLERHIRLAVEHLFEEAYAAVDEEFLSMLRSNRQGWVPVDSLCTHLHVGTAAKVDGAAVKSAAKSSNILVINEGEGIVRRKTPMRKITLNGTQNRTVLLERLPTSMDDISLFRAAYDLLLPWGPIQMLRLVHSGGIGETPILRNISACTRKYSSEDIRYLVLVFAAPEPAAAFASILSGAAPISSWVLPPKEDVAADATAVERVNSSGNDILFGSDGEMPLRGLSCSIPRPEALSVEALSDALETFRSFGIAASHLTVAADHVAKGSRSDSTASAKRQHNLGTADDSDDNVLVMKVERKHAVHRDRTSSSGSGLAIPPSECDAFRRKVSRSGGSDIVHEREPDSKWTNIRSIPALAAGDVDSRNGISVTVTRTPPRHVKTSGITDARIRAASEGTGLLVTSVDETSPALSCGAKARWSVMPRRNSGTCSPLLPEAAVHANELKLSIAKGPTPDGSKGFARRRTSTASGCEIKSPGAFVA